MPVAGSSALITRMSHPQSIEVRLVRYGFAPERPQFLNNAEVDSRKDFEGPFPRTEAFYSVKLRSAPKMAHFYSF